MQKSLISNLYLGSGTNSVLFNHAAQLSSEFCTTSGHFIVAYTQKPVTLPRKRIIALSSEFFAADHSR